MEDKTLTCVGCQQDFTWTAGEQKFYNDQNPPFTPPKRCKRCRQEAKRQRESQRY